MARMSSEGTGTILLALAVASVAAVGIVLYGRNAAAAAKKPGASPGGPLLEPLGFLPGLKVGDTVVVDTAEANIPADRGGAIPLLVCRVDMLLSDPTLVSVAAVGAYLKGTIARSAIKKVLTVDPGSLQT
jgi:hypothetical protein